MKKYIIAILLIIAFQGTCFADDMRTDPIYSSLDIENENYFRSPLNNSLIDPQVNETDLQNLEYNAGFENTGRKITKLKDGDLPLFKRCRLIITHKIRQIMPEPYQPKPRVEEEFNFEDEDYLINDEEENKTPLKDKLKFWKKKTKDTKIGQQETEPSENSTISESIRSELAAQDKQSKDTLSFETGISQQVSENEMVLDAETVNYDDETEDFIATGRPVLNIIPQRAKIVADKMIYNQESNIIKAIGNVLMTKDGMPTKGDYAEVDMNEEIMYMDNASSTTNVMIVDAEKTIQQNDKLILLNGKFHSDKSQIYSLSSRMVGPRFSNMIVNEDDLGLFFGDPKGNHITLDIDRIYVDAGKNHDKFTAKNIKIYRKGKHWFTWPSITAYTDKDRTYFEANYPEFGTKTKLGMFVGPGFTFGGPVGSIIKVIPFLNYQQGKFGFGGAVKYRNKFNYTDFGYGTSADVFFLRGIQRLDDNLFLHYSANTYSDEWFIGHRMAKYMAELYYDKDHYIPNFLGLNRGLTFRHRASFGLMEDNDRNFYGEKFSSGGTTTVRSRYMAQIVQNLYSYQKPEESFYFNFSWMLQGSAALYGTGDTQFIARTGPFVHVQYKRWMQDLAFYQSGYDDNTPMPRYDAYRYGHSSIYLTEIFRINKYLSVGWSGMVNLSNDAPNGKLFQENRFVVAIGPDDLRVRLGYDFVRQTTYFGFDVAFDTKGTTINYGRTEIKNPERFGKKDKPERKLDFTPAPKQTPDEVRISAFRRTAKPKVKELEYAQIINIEDPDKEITD